MPIELADLTLNRIHNIVTIEDAALVHHQGPGLDGNAVQNLGRHSVRLRIEGIFYGPTAQDDLEQLRALYLKREPVEFIAYIVGQTYASQVVLDRFEVTEAAREPEQFSYALVVSEYVEPPKTATGIDAVNQNLALDAQNLMDIASLPDMLTLGSIPELTNPFTPLKGSLDQVQDASSGLLDATEGLKTLLGA